MKLTVTQSALSRGLATVARAVSPRSTLPVLANILIATENGRLRLSATNLEIGITCWIPCQTKEEGAVTVPARIFQDTVNKLPPDMIDLILNDKTNALSVKCGGFSSSVKGISAEEFPPMPQPDVTGKIMVGVDSLKSMIKSTVYACSDDEARPALQGALMELSPENGKMSMAATDGFRIATKNMQLAGIENPFKVIIPARALSEFSRIATDPQETVMITFPAGRGQVVFRLKDAELVSQLIDGNFPPYDKIIPTGYKTRVTVATTALLRACEQAEIIAREGNNVVRFSIKPSVDDKPGVMELAATSESAGAAEVVLETEVHGFGLQLAFNVKFVKEALADGTTMPFVSLDFNQANTPGVIRGVGDDSWLNVLMPMHLG